MESNIFNNKPLVSILIPNFNKALYLRGTLDSVLAQTYTNWECIIVDDHSTDNSWEILLEYATKDDRFKLYKRPDNRMRGGNAARNIAIEIAIGDILAFLDSDDIWFPSRLEKAINYLDKQKYCAIYSGAIIFNGKSKIIVRSRSISENESIFDFIVREDTIAPTPTLVIKSYIAKKILFDEKMLRHQDYDFFIRVNQTCRWQYFDNFDVQINWNRPDFKIVNYQSCIPFYKKHALLSKDKEIRYNYIRRITSLSVRENPDFNVSDFFKKILISEKYEFSTKEFFLFNFPYFFHYMSKLKWFFRKI